MKLNISKMFVVMSMGISAYYLLKMHPEYVCRMKKVGKETSRKMYQMLDEDN